MFSGAPLELVNALQVALLLAIIAFLGFVRGELNTRIREREERERIIRVNLENTEALVAHFKGGKSVENPVQVPKA